MFQTLASVSVTEILLQMFHFVWSPVDYENTRIDVILGSPHAFHIVQPNHIELRMLYSVKF